MDLVKKIELFSLYFTIALVGVAIIVGLIVFYTKKDKFNGFLKGAIIFFVGYAIAILGIMSYMEFDDIFSDESLDMSTYGLLFYPLLAESIAAIVLGIIAFIVGVYKKDKLKYVGVVSIFILLAGFIAILVCMTKYSKSVLDWYPNINLVALIISCVAFCLVIVAIYFLGKKSKWDTKSLVYGAISIALAFALSYIKMFRLPQGGSITLASMLPLVIFSCMFGTRKGTIVCLIYGLLQAVQDPWIIHPTQFLLDYPLAYGVLGISGLFMEKELSKKYKIVDFIIGAIVAVLLRFICHVLSGAYAFADYVDFDVYSSAIVYSLTYNSFVFLDMLIAILAGSTLFTSKSFREQMVKSTSVIETVGELEDEELDDIDKKIIESQNENIEE